jgi:hypothetical protein
MWTLEYYILIPNAVSEIQYGSTTTRFPFWELNYKHLDGLFDITFSNLSPCMQFYLLFVHIPLKLALSFVTSFCAPKGYAISPPAGQHCRLDNSLTRTRIQASDSSRPYIFSACPSFLLLLDVVFQTCFVHNRTLLRQIKKPTSLWIRQPQAHKI